MNNINFLVKNIFLSAVILISISKSAQAVKINRQNFCSLTVRDYKQEYTIFVSRLYLKSVIEQLNVIGINCRNETSSSNR